MVRHGKTGGHQSNSKFHQHFQQFPMVKRPFLGPLQFLKVVLNEEDLQVLEKSLEETGAARLRMASDAGPTMP